MRYDHGSRENRQRAAFLLGKLKLELVDASDAVETPMTMQAATSSPHWRISAVAGVHVYKTTDGWNADLAFKGMPPGVPALIGNAVPCASRKDALESALRQLSLCAEREKVLMANSDTRSTRWFKFDGVEIGIDAGQLPAMAISLARDGYSSFMAAGRLALMRHAIADDEELTAANLEASSPEVRARFQVACTVAMALGRTQFTLADGVWADYAPTPPGPMR
jgi:hypothetical protein